MNVVQPSMLRPRDKCLLLSLLGHPPPRPPRHMAHRTARRLCGSRWHDDSIGRWSVNGLNDGVVEGRDAGGRVDRVADDLVQYGIWDPLPVAWRAVTR